MANTVRNTSRPGVFVKFKTAEAWVKQCICTWVEERKSIRELSLTERLNLMRQNLEACGSLVENRPMSRREGYLPPINVAGEKEVMPRSEIWTRERKYNCLIEARHLASGSC